MIQIEEGRLLLKTTDFRLIRAKEDVINIRPYEVMAGEESYKYIAGPAVPMDTRLPIEEFHGRGATQVEALQD
jgi:hypothetical protein